MPGIKQLVKYISDDVSINVAQWVLAGQTPGGYPTLNSFGNVSPIGSIASLSAVGISPMLVTTVAPHGLSTGAWVTIFGATGHNSSTWPETPDPPAFQHSINGCWQVTAVSATSFTVSDGATPGASNGYYTFGGSIVSSPLTDGHILLGGQHVAEGSAPPRIVFTLPRSEWPDKGMWNPSTANPQDDLGTQKLARSINTELYVFKVFVWGQYVNTALGIGGDPEGGDKDVTQLLYHQIIRSIDQMARGTWDITPGSFTKEQTGAATINSAGEEFVFFLKIGSPIPETFLEFAPPLNRPGLNMIPNPQTG